MDSHPNSSTVHVGDYEYNTRDLIGHGAFAVVFKGRHRKVHCRIHYQSTPSRYRLRQAFESFDKPIFSLSITYFVHVLKCQFQYLTYAVFMLSRENRKESNEKK